MFSIAAACSADDENECEEVARAYYAETSHGRRAKRQDEEEREGKNRKRGRRNRKCQKTYGRSTSVTLEPNSILAHVNQASFAAALLGHWNEEQGQVRVEDEDEEEEHTVRTWSSYVHLAGPICCSPDYKARSQSIDDQTMLMLLLDDKQQDGRSWEESADNRNSATAAVACGASEPGQRLMTVVNMPPRQSAVLDPYSPDSTNMNNVTFSTSASNGGFTDPTPTLTSPSYDIVTINVSGLRFQTYQATLERFPDTLLGDPAKRSAFHNPKLGEYFFDRHRGAFEAIMYYYQSNGRKLSKPPNVPPDIFIKELQYFELGQSVVDRFLESQGCFRPKKVRMPRNHLQRSIWLLMEHPDSSCLARVLAFLSVFVILISTVSFCLETVPDLKYQPRNWSSMENETSGKTGGQGEEPVNFDNPFFIVELSCMCWFTLEFGLRFASCPSKLHFCKSFLNIIDFVAIMPFFVNLAWASARGAGGSTPPFGVLRIFRLVRVFRIFKLSRHSRGLQILGKTFTASVQELCLLVFFLGLGLVLFSSAVYIAESGYDSGFDSIPAAFWYVIVTMTTVGYGDLTPVGPWGKLVGGMCAILGVLVLALPVPVIVANFKHYYSQETRLARMRAVQAEDAGDGHLCDDDDDSAAS